jgi:hypothetical protein
VELYKFFWGALAWIATVAVLWPVNVPLLALAYKVQNGAKPLSIEQDELWYRSLVGAGMLALLTVALLFLDYLFVDLTDFPSGPTHLVIFMAYVPAAAYLLVISFAFSELLEGLGVLIIYIGLPVLVLFLINAILGIWEPWLDFFYGYLKQPT